MCEMENMKAIRIHNYGGPEVLRFEDAPRPTPASGELLIAVHAASVNAIDWKIRAGYLKDVFPVPLPFIPGWDVSGRRSGGSCWIDTLHCTRNNAACAKFFIR